VHSARGIQERLNGQLKTLWDRGYVSVGDLWDLYSRYPYLPRLRDRSVMEDAVRQVLNSITWEQEGFALATGRDEETGKFTGLAIPHHDSFGLITDHVLLVRPDLALHQRQQETATTAANAGGIGGGVLITGPTEVKSDGHSDDDDSSAPKPKTRFFGVFRIDPEKYGRDFTRLQQEILPHLIDAEAADVKITVEIEATRPSGFLDDKIRIVGENARVLKFEQSDFE
jgi:hypothetical protein